MGSEEAKLLDYWENKDCSALLGIKMGNMFVFKQKKISKKKKKLFLGISISITSGIASSPQSVTTVGTNNSDVKQSGHSTKLHLCFSFSFPLFCRPLEVRM
uniref:Uncharacterized protein n=1 Tax=Micrurus lemniscatus lemniscatus TaxID=129467 RepID=A0A2D4JH90_MICLE